MAVTTRYPSPLGEILLAEENQTLIGVWFIGQKHFPADLSEQEGISPVLAQTARWLDAYFSGRVPEKYPPLAPDGTEFQKRVWAVLAAIPYGKTMTYGEVAKALGLPAGASRAVGSAVGRNPISLLIPCHRVVGAGGTLTGYAGGVEKKEALLRLEAGDFSFLMMYRFAK